MELSGQKTARRLSSVPGALSPGTYRKGWLLLGTRVGLFERSRNSVHCISWYRHLQLIMCPDSLKHLFLHRDPSMPLPKYLQILSQRTIIFLGAGIGSFSFSAILKFPWVQFVANRIEREAILGFPGCPGNAKPRQPSLQSSCIVARLL